jgi:hypothetical protein
MVELDDAHLRMIMLYAKGYRCSQMLLLMGLEARGEENAALVRTMAGLITGCGDERCTCGALTGGCCLLALYAAKGSESEEASEEFPRMLWELNEWFFDIYEDKNGRVDCTFIRNSRENPDPPQNRCFDIVVATYFKCVEILGEHGFDVNER